LRWAKSKNCGDCGDSLGWLPMEVNIPCTAYSSSGSQWAKWPLIKGALIKEIWAKRSERNAFISRSMKKSAKCLINCTSESLLSLMTSSESSYLGREILWTF
ncbi:hypothetical protein, partial [Pyrococcus kukulkanii]